MTQNSRDMRREFASRDELTAYLREQFPQAADIDDHIAPMRGGRAAAEAALDQIDPERYAATRNAFNGRVTRLSPYIRYGVLTLAEVRRRAFERAPKRHQVEKFINELGWRDYWQRLYAKLGDGIWRDQEPLKTGFTPEEYADSLPDDIVRGTTGRVCVDSFSQDLRETGYLHNHARMWMAAYIVHFRRVKWQAGARWFLMHLLDGDPASNNMSWQWVASAFSHKPYFFNRENLEKYTDGIYCERCPLYGRCDFEGSYERISERIFPNLPAPADEGARERGREQKSRGRWHR